MLVADIQIVASYDSLLIMDVAKSNFVQLEPLQSVVANSVIV